MTESAQTSAPPSILDACQAAEYWLTEELHRPGQATPREILRVLRTAIAGATGASDCAHWDEDPCWPVEDWKYEVANDDTRLGYHAWVAVERENFR